MIVETGHFALILGLFVSLVQGVLPLVGAARRQRTLMALAEPGAYAQLLCAAVAFGALMYAYVASDFSVATVYQNSHTDKPLIYKIAGVWGNHEGSLLLWVFVMALFGAAVARFGGALRRTLKVRAIAVQGLIGSCFIGFLLATSDPFLRLIPAPEQGEGLNPLLQDPGLAFHPPMLYLGYVGLSLTYSFAVAALIEGRVDAAWARWVRPWTLVAWSFLTGGIALGSWWAYYDLGWGGWWYWDPVENASFMPWLLATALLHSAIVVEKRDALKRWTVLLAILAFGLSLVGTFLVRSGVLTSVHAFAVDPGRGLFILGFLVVLIGGALALYAWRAPSLEPGGLFQPISREGGLVLNNLLLSTACATVLLGTLYPLLLGATTGSSVTVGPPYFHATFVPLMVPLLAAVAVGPLLAWKRADLAGALQRLRLVALAAAGAALLLWGLSGGPVMAALGIGLAAWLILGALLELVERLRPGRAGAWDRLRRVPRATLGMTIAHAALGVSILGMTGSLFSVEEIRGMKPGDQVAVAGYSIRLDGIDPVDGPNYVAQQARFTVTDGAGRTLAMTPSKRRFTAPPQVITESAIHTTGASDLYLVLGEDDAATGRWGVRIYYNPLVPWIWFGAGFMLLGGAVSLSDRRYRVGAPARRPVAAPTPVEA